MDQQPQETIKFTARELLMIQRAAEMGRDMAEKSMEAKFYQHVGKTFIQKIFIWIGMFALGWGAAKGWIAPGK